MKRIRRQISAESVASANEPLTDFRCQVRYRHRPRRQLQRADYLNPSKSLPAFFATSLLAAVAVAAAVAQLTNGHSEPQEVQLLDNRITGPAAEQAESSATTTTTTTTTATTNIMSHNNLVQLIASPLSRVARFVELQQSDQQEVSFNDRWNEYWSRQPFPSGYTQSSITLLACLITTIIFLIVVGNLLVCIAIFTEKSLKPTQNWFIASLAVSDMLLGLVVMPFSLARELMGFWVFGQLWCDIHEAVDVLLTTASINTLCLISLDRYWSITQAVSYLKKRTPKRGAFMIAFVWVFSAAVSLPPLFGWKKPAKPEPELEPQLEPADKNSQGNSKNQNQTTTTDGLVTNGDSIYANNDDAGDKDAYTDDLNQTGRLDSLATSNSERLSSWDRKRRKRKRPESFDKMNNDEDNDNNDEMAIPLLQNSNNPTIPIELSSETTTKTFNQAPIDQIEGSKTVSGPPALPPVSEYPQCELSDDLGYVLYSAFGSFYIPCAVMVFTYIKIFLAARSRARRAINKPNRGNGANKRPPANRRTTGPDGGAKLDNKHLATIQAGGETTAISGLVASYDGQVSHTNFSTSHDELARTNKTPEPIMRGGKIVLVERKKSLAASSMKMNLKTTATTSGPLSCKTLLMNEHDKSEEKDLSCNKICSDTRKVSIEEQVESPLNKGTEEVEIETTSQHCTLTTSGVRHASPSALNSSASNDSSMITVMNSSMNDMPVTRFNFRDPTTLSEPKQSIKVQKRPQGTDEQPSEETTRMAAALLDAIRQVKADEQTLVSEILAPPAIENSQNNKDPVDSDQVPDIVMERRATDATVTAIPEAEIKPANDNNSCSRSEELSSCSIVAANQDEACCGLNTTNETCFMTIEEDSDMFEAEIGRTITMVAGNASQRQTSSLGKNQANIVTMMPATDHQHHHHHHHHHQEQQQPLVCQNAVCRVAQKQTTRSASSYCGSSMTINDDDIDDCVDDELLTDDCNGYSVSCAYDHYCPNDDSSCVQCQECEQDERQQAQQICSNSRHLSINDSPSRKQLQQQRLLHQRQQSSKCQHYRNEQNEIQSITGDDNLSLTEYRSQDDYDNSSIVGHDVLDATETRYYGSEKKKSIADNDNNNNNVASRGTGDRKKSSIGFRLARLGSAAPLSNYGGGLLAGFASGQHHHQQQQQQSGGTKNLKALRQNFFMKLNQLTAKSATKQQEPKSKSKKSASTSPTGKSSAHSSGTSYEPSVDCATTSNVDYPPETTIGDDSEQHSSSDMALKMQSAASKSKEFTNGPSVEKTDDRNNKQSSNDKFARSRCESRSDSDRAVLLKQPPNGGSGTNFNDQAKSPAIGSIDKVQPSVQIVGGKSQRFDLEHNASTNTAGTTIGKKRTTTSGHNYTSSTMISSSAGSAQPGQRAYLASDNERHKRKLAKARERRATLILGLIMAAFICSWMPFFTYYVLRAICTYCRDNVSPRIQAFIFWMGYCNSAINPIIYTIFNRDFRKAFRKILFKCL